MGGEVGEAVPAVRPTSPSGWMHRAVGGRCPHGTLDGPAPAGAPALLREPPFRRAEGPPDRVRSGRSKSRSRP
jgi:hypothetical protein